MKDCFDYKPKSCEFCEHCKIHLHREVAWVVERISDCYDGATGSIVGE